MHTGFFTHGNNFFQAEVFVQSKRNGNFIQFVFRQNDRQIIDSSKYLNSAVHRSGFHVVIENSADQIAPLRIGNDPVNIFLGRTAVADHQNLFLIAAVLPHIA